MTDEQIQLPFTGVLDESTDPRHLAPGSLVSATNCVFDQDGQLQVRYGYTMLPQVGLSSIFRLAVFAFELIAISLAGEACTYSPNESVFSVRDTSTPVQVTHAPLDNDTTTFTSWSIVDVNGYRIIAWVDGGDNFPRAAVYDQQTGAQVAEAKISSTQSLNVSLGALGTTAVLVVADSGAANLRAYTLQTSPLGTWSAGTVVSDGNYSSTTGAYTAAFSATLVTVAYEQTGGGNSTLRVRGFNSALSLQYNVSNSLGAGTNGFQGLGSRMTDGEQLWFGIYAATSGFANHVIAVECNPANGVSAASFAVGFDTGGPGAMQIAFERLSATQQVMTVTDGSNSWMLQVTTAGVVAASTVNVFNIRTLGAPIRVASLSTVLQMWSEPSAGAAGGPPQGTYFLMDLRPGTPGTYPQLVAVLAPTIASLGLQPAVSLLFPATPWAVNAAGKLETVAPILRTVAGRQGIELFTVDLNGTSRYSAASLGKELYLGGARYDGQVLTEDGFAQPPTLSVANNGGAGSTFNYIVTYAWIDVAGNVEESAPTPVATVTSGATPNVQITVRTTGISRKQRTPATPTSGKIAILLYRTQALASGDTTYYLVTKEPFAEINTTASQTLVFNDTLSDAALTDGTHPVQYTVTGELVHNVPETFLAITSHKLRVWGIGADQRTIWYSSQYADGVVPFFNNTFQLTVDDAGEPLTCLASLYDKLLIFTRSKIYVVYGDGPSAAGTGNDLTTPQRVPSPAGCIDSRSIVQTPQGVFFQSQRGLELIDPSLGVTFIGQPVSKTTSTYPTCTSAAMVEFNSVIRWTFTQVDGIPTSPGQSGAIVNFDMRRGRWAVHRITWNRQGAGFYAPMQAGVVHPTFGYVAANNDTSPNAPNVYRENTVADSNAWTDFNTFFVPVTLTTAWIKAQDLQGWQSIRRIRVLANYYDHHDLSIQLAYDYQGIADSYSFADATIQGFRSGSWEQVQVAPGTGRRCEAVQVTLATNSLSGFATGRGAGFVGLAFEVRPQKGGFRNIPIAARS